MLNMARATEEEICNYLAALAKVDADEHFEKGDYTVTWYSHKLTWCLLHPDGAMTDKWVRKNPQLMETTKRILRKANLEVPKWL